MWKNRLSNQIFAWLEAGRLLFAIWNLLFGICDAGLLLIKYL